MHIISYKKIKDFIIKHPQSQNALNAWYSIVRSEKFGNFNDVKQIFPSADQVKNFVVFNISGNNYRLIAYFRYKLNRLFIRQILTHSEYDKDKWKDDEWYDSQK